MLSMENGWKLHIHRQIRSIYVDLTMIYESKIVITPPVN